IGAEIAFHEPKPIQLPLRRDYEHALFVLEGDVSMEDRRLDGDTLHYIGAQRDELRISGTRASRLLLIGGQPLRERRATWANSVAGSGAAASRSPLAGRPVEFRCASG